MSKKAKLALQLLEEELELINKEEQDRIKGGNRVFTSGIGYTAPGNTGIFR